MKKLYNDKFVPTDFEDITEENIDFLLQELENPEPKNIFTELIKMLKECDACLRFEDEKEKEGYLSKIDNLTLDSIKKYL